MTIEKEIKEAIKARKLVTGSRSVMKGLKNSEINEVICSNNCTKALSGELDYYSRNFGIEIKSFKGNSRQLGEICARPFNIMLLGIKK